MQKSIHTPKRLQLSKTMQKCTKHWSKPKPASSVTPTRTAHNYVCVLCTFLWHTSQHWTVLVIFTLILRTVSGTSHIWSNSGKIIGYRWVKYKNVLFQAICWEPHHTPTKQHRLSDRRLSVWTTLAHNSFNTLQIIVQPESKHVWQNSVFHQKSQEIRVD